MKTLRILSLAFITLAVSVGMADIASGYSAESIDADVDGALKNFELTTGASDILAKAKGVLIFPKVFKAGFVLGGEYGEGALRIGGKSAGYYSTAAASFGFQLGGQVKTLIIAFMEQNALDKFRNSSGWKIGADASIAVIAVGAGGSVDSSKVNEPIVAFVLDQKGLMYNITLEGAKITKLNR